MTIEDRLTRLERRNRRLTLALVLIGVVAALIVTTGMDRADAVPEKVTARRFELVDENGKVQAVLGVANDSPFLNLSDKNGKLRVGLGVTMGMVPSLSLFDDNGNPRAGLMVIKDSSILNLSDANGHVRANLGTTKNGGNVLLMDENGKVRASLAGGTNPAVQLSDENGRVRAGLIVRNGGFRPGFLGPGLQLFDANGKARAGLGVNRDGPFLGLSDENGQVFRSLP